MITIFLGPKGSGKDLEMTRRMKKRKNRGDTVLTNYQVGFADGVINAGLLLDIAQGNVELKDCSIGLSEIHLIIDPRRSSSKRTVLISYVLSQVRKRSVRLYCNTQTLRQVESRLLELADYVVYCRRISKNHFYYRVYDVQNNWRLKARYITDGRKTYPLYSTEQVITDFDPGLLGIHKTQPKRPRERKKDPLGELDLAEYLPDNAQN